jgi:hypothetical protein
MIPKPLAEKLDVEDLQRLLDDPVRESRKMEYKRDIDLSTPKGKTKFLAGIRTCDRQCFGRGR